MDRYPIQADPYPVQMDQYSDNVGPLQKLPSVDLKGEDERYLDDQRTINQSQFPSINDVSRFPSSKLADHERPPPILKRVISEPESESDYEVGLNVNMKQLE